VPSGRVPFEFVWCREQTAADDYRRSIIVDPDDEHATIKDLSAIWSPTTPESAFLNPSKARTWSPERTVLIEDTASKGRTSAGNLLILPSCCEDAIGSEYDGMARLRDFIEEKLINCDDVRTVLPRRL
jgi:hypothetical protein